MDKGKQQMPLHIFFAPVAQKYRYSRGLLNRSQRNGTAHPPTFAWGVPWMIGVFQFQAFAFCKLG